MVTALTFQGMPQRLTSRRHGIGFWLAGYVFAITIAFSAIPAPLYVLYQARDHFGSLLVTIIFGVYALGVAGWAAGGYCSSPSPPTWRRACCSCSGQRCPA